MSPRSHAAAVFAADQAAGGGVFKGGGAGIEGLGLILLKNGDSKEINPSKPPSIIAL